MTASERVTADSPDSSGTYRLRSLNHVSNVVPKFVSVLRARSSISLYAISRKAAMRSSSLTLSHLLPSRSMMFWAISFT